nr:hypothetical protein [Bartonella apihabitans]
METEHRDWFVFLEKHQIKFYFLAILGGTAIGYLFRVASSANEVLNFILPVLLFVTFLQVPVSSVIDNLGNKRFVAALLVGNFVFIPILVALLLLIGAGLFFQLSDPSHSPYEQSLQAPYLAFAFYGMILLCAPCVDYVVSFCRLAKGDSSSLTAALPALLIIQLAFLILFSSGWFYDEQNMQATRPDIIDFIISIFQVLLVPLALAWILQSISRYNKVVEYSTSFMKNSVVMITAFTLMIIAAYAFSELFSIFDDNGYAFTKRSADEATGIYENTTDYGSSEKAQLHAFIYGIAFYGLYACLAPFVGFFTAKLFKLCRKQEIALSFSVSTRNSLVLLPFLLTISPADEQALVAAVVLTQTCVELVAEIIYVRFIPCYVKKHVRSREIECER